MGKELFNQQLVTELPLTNRIASSIPLQAGGENITVEDFLLQSQTFIQGKINVSGFDDRVNIFVTGIKIMSPCKSIVMSHIHLFSFRRPKPCFKQSSVCFYIANLQG